MNGLPKLAPLRDHPAYKAKADMLRQVDQADAEAVKRLAEIESLMAKLPIAEDPADVLLGKRPADLGGLQAEHIELRNKRERLGKSRRAFIEQLDTLSAELSVEASPDVFNMQHELADQYLQALRQIREIEKRERENIGRLGAAGYGLAGVQGVVAQHPDWETLEREAVHEVSAINARIRRIAETRRKAA